MSLLNPKAHLVAATQLVSLLTRHRELTWELTKREVRERYAGQILGTAWAVGHPLLLMALYVFIFGYIFPARMGIDDVSGSFTTYILGGLIPWLVYAEAMNKGCGVIIANASLVKQVVFPIEVLPVKGVFATLMTQAIATAILLGYMLVIDGGWPSTVVLLPVLVVIQMFAMIGTCYAFASVSVFIRDLKDIVLVFNTAGLFLAPILYPPSLVSDLPKPLVFVLHANPFSHLVWCYQDVLYYGRFEHPWSWLVVILLSLGIFYGGYRVFRKLKPMFGDAL